MSIMRSAFPFSVAMGLVLFAAGVGAAGPDTGINVNVVNTPANPVPVTGSVTGTVTGTVGLAPGTSILIDNTVGDPVRVRNVNDALQPVQFTGSCRTEAFINCGPAGFHVPAGKRLIIEYASLVVCAFPGQTTTLLLLTTVNGVNAEHAVGTTPAAAPPGSTAFGCNGASASAQTSIAKQVRLYADPGTIVGFNGERSNQTGNQTLTFTMSGYLVDVPLTP